MHRVLEFLQKYPKINYFLLFVLFLGIDFAFKIKIRVSGGFFVCNNGVSWGSLPNISIFWLIIALIFINLLYLWFFRNKTSFLPFLLILSGGAANIIDRLYFGCVTDFIKIPFLPFPLFNIADMLITCGFIILCLFLFKKQPLPVYKL